MNAWEDRPYTPDGVGGVDGVADPTPSERVEALAEVAAVPIPPVPEHDGNYWRGALKVVAQRKDAIETELAQLERRRHELISASRLTDNARREAILGSRGKLTKAEAARLLGIAPGTYAKLLAHELRRRGMGA